MWRLIILIQFLFATSFSQNLDIEILKKVNTNRNQKADRFFKGISNSVTPASVTIPISFISYSLINKDKELLNQGFEQGAAVLGNTILTKILKNSIKRKRPYETYPALNNAYKVKSYSFPSGHTSSSFALVTILSLQYPKWYVVAPAFTWAGLTAYSRMHLGVHYPSDVLAGAILGTGTAILTSKIFKKDNLQNNPSIINIRINI